MPKDDCFLTADEEQELLKLGKVSQYRKGDIIFAAGAKAFELHYILRGWVNIFKINNEGRQVSVGLRYQGEFAGIASFACDHERGCHGQALIDSEIVILSRENFARLLRRFPELNDKMFCLLGSRLRDTQNNMVYFISNQTEKRLALTLLDIGRFFGRQEGDKRTVNIKLPQEQIAHIIGCSRQTVNTLLTEFKVQGYIEMRGREIIAVYPDKLRSCVG